MLAFVWWGVASYLRISTFLNISLPEPLKAYLDSKIEAGEYGDASEYVSELIQHDQARDASADSEVAALEMRLVKAVGGEKGAIDLTADEIRKGGVVALLRDRLKAA